MNKFLYSGKLLYILAALLLLTFFLPDLIGPVPAILIGGLVIGFALYVYNQWTRNDRSASETKPETDQADQTDYKD